MPLQKGEGKGCMDKMQQVKRSKSRAGIWAIKDALHIDIKVPGVVGEKLQVVHLW